MGLGGVEPPTFPILSGRSNQLFDPAVAFHVLDFSLSAHCFRACGEFFGEGELPGAAVLKGCGVAPIVICQPLGEVRSMADIEAASGQAPQDVYVEPHWRK